MYACESNNAQVIFILCRDLKPENVMYDPKGKTLRIIDFGSGVKF